MRSLQQNDCQRRTSLLVRCVRLFTVTAWNAPGGIRAPMAPLLTHPVRGHTGAPVLAAASKGEQNTELLTRFVISKQYKGIQRPIVGYG